MHKTTVIENCCTHQPNKPAVNLNSPQLSFRHLLIVIPFALVLLISTSYQQETRDFDLVEQEFYSPSTRTALKDKLSCSADTTQFTGNLNFWELQLINAFYSDRGYKPVWIGSKGLTDRADELVNIIEYAREFGLEPENYHISDIRNHMIQIRKKADKSNETNIDLELEILLTNAAFRMMINLHAGYQAFDSALFAHAWVNELPEILMKGIAGQNVLESLLSLEPRFIEYQKLRKANAIFIRSNALNDHIADIKYPCKDSTLLMNQIQEALVSLGYLDNRDYSNNITNALQRFQQFHGLIPDGKPGTNTIEALQKSTLYRYRVLALNLDRLRKMPYSDSSRLYINVPAYSLKIYEDNRLLDTFRIIVGNPATPTPLLTGTMERIIANPCWYVPKSIAINEILPKIKEDSTYLEKNRFKILDRNYNLVSADAVNLKYMSEGNFDYTFRQDRGLDNSLGKVKFIFSNPHAVYLHDTPGKTLFQKDLRAFSHGCIRVEHPERLAGYILSEVNSDTTSFERLLNSEQQRDISVNSPLPVQITYITCEADEQGRVYFYKDIYEMDNKDMEALNPSWEFDAGT